MDLLNPEDSLESIWESVRQYLDQHLVVSIISVLFLFFSIICFFFSNLAALFFLTYESMKSLTNQHAFSDPKFDTLRYMISASVGETVNFFSFEI